MIVSFDARPGVLVCGCDEAGRGPLAGPVVAAAVVLPEGFSHPLVNDSKKLNARQREQASEIIESSAIHFGLGMADHDEIDELNILRASFLAMHRAIEEACPEPGLLLVDGNRFQPYRDVPFLCVVGGDAKYAEIAAASILAKTNRDRIMEDLHEEYPAYNWKSNKGYPTREHREAIRIHGPSPYHRRTFRLLKEEPLSIFPKQITDP